MAPPSMRINLLFSCILLRLCCYECNSWVLRDASCAANNPRSIAKGYITPTYYFRRQSPRLLLSSCPIIDRHAASKLTIDKNSSAPLVERGVVPKTLSRSAGIGFILSSLRGTPHKFLAKLQQKHGENFIIPPNIVVLNDPNAIKSVLETHNLPKTPKVRFGYKSIFYGNSRSSGGILAANWKKWIEQRRMTAPALGEKTIGDLAPKFYNASMPFFGYLDKMAEKGQPIDMSDAFTAVTVDTIGKVLLGKTFDMCSRMQKQAEDEEVPFFTALHVLTDEAVRQMILPGWWLRRRPKKGKVDAARRIIDEFLEKSISDRLEELSQKSNMCDRNTTDLLNVLLEAEAEGVLSREEVKGQLLTFVFAGFDTLAPTLTYMLWEISQNTTLQNELAEEAMSVLPDRHSFPNVPDALVKLLPKLDRTFSETNRKHPAAAMGTSRKVGREAITVGDGIELPAQSSVLIPPWTLHRNERFWSDPELFDPSRFEHAIEEPYAYQPFSGGPRNCIGAKLARAETLSLLGPLLRRYVVHCDTKQVPKDHYSLTRKPRKPVLFNISIRPEQKIAWTHHP